MNENLETVRKRVERRGKLGTKLEETMAMELPKMYPTPTVVCEEGGEQSHMVERTKSGGFVSRRKGSGITYGAKLSDAMLYLEKKKILPTPTVNDSKNNGGISQQKAKERGYGVNLNGVVGGKLNPNFVEFLMGFPMDWTEIELTESKPSVTQSSHRSQEKSDLPLKKFYRTPTAMDQGDNSFKYAAKMLKGKTSRVSKERVQKTLSMDVAMEHLKNNKDLIEAYDEKFKTRPQLPPKDKFLNYLKKNLDRKSLYEAGIIKKTTIDHWLRSDHCFSYPTKEHWNMIKPYLKEIKFDYQMTFEIESDWE